jgi:hypothetical protein
MSIFYNNTINEYNHITHKHICENSLLYEFMK